MKTKLVTLALAFSVLLVGCNRDHVDERLITSYSIKTNSETNRKKIVNDFETFLARFGLKKSASPYAETAGVKTQGESTELWESIGVPYSITISKNPNPKYLSGDLAWDFRGSKEDWKKEELEIQRFQREVVIWFKKRPDVVHKESSYWDGSMKL